MDTSKEYIKMCEQAEEIQVLQDEYDQKYSIIPNLYGKYIEELGCGESIIPPAGQAEPKIEIWLPRQDQLQEMVINKDWSKVAIDKGVLFLHTKLTNEGYYNIDSFEKVWLIFVMNIKYNKQWNKETNKWEVTK